MLTLLNLILGVLIGSWVGNFIAYYTRELPKVLIDEEDEREPEDVFFEYFKFSSHKGRQGKLSWIHNFPILGYFLSNRERTGNQQIRRLIIEVITAIMYGGVLMTCSLTPRTAFVLIACSFLIAAFITDFEHMLLPDQITLPLLWIGLAASLAPIFVTAKESVTGAIVGYGLFWLVNAVYRYFRKYEGMYPGDFKLNAAIGSFVGIFWLFPIILCALILLVVFAVIGYLMRVRKIEIGILQQESPYGCFSSLMTILFLISTLPH